MKSRQWTWATRQGRMCLSPTYLCSGCSGQCRSWTVCHGYNRSLNNCGRNPSNAIGTLGRPAARSAAKWIKLDMNRHVVNYHLNLAQLWRCPVSGCTVWKGTPQDCMDHLRVAHAVPAAVKSANLGNRFPPWTVRRQMWTDTLKSPNSGISTDVLLFSCLALGPSLSGVPEGNFPMSPREGTTMSRWGQSSPAPDSLWGRQGRMCLSPTYLCSGCSGQCRSWTVCRGYNRSLNNISRSGQFVFPEKHPAAGFGWGISPQISSYNSPGVLSPCAGCPGCPDVAFGSLGSRSGCHHLRLPATHPAGVNSDEGTMVE